MLHLCVDNLLRLPRLTFLKQLADTGDHLEAAFQGVLDLLADQLQGRCEPPRAPLCGSVTPEATSKSSRTRVYMETRRKEGGESSRSNPD